MAEYIFDKNRPRRAGCLRVGDWVAYDCYTGDSIASIAQIIDIEPNNADPDNGWLVLSAPAYPNPKTVRRTCADIKVGLIRKILNPKF